MNLELQEYHERKDRQERLEHRDVLLAIAVVLKQKEGVQLFKYLFKHFEVASVPDNGLSGTELHEFLGFLKAGNSIYKLACEADSEIAASILAKLERDRYADLYEQHRIEQGLKTRDRATEEPSDGREID